MTRIDMILYYEVVLSTQDYLLTSNKTRHHPSPAMMRVIHLETFKQFLPIEKR